MDNSGSPGTDVSQSGAKRMAGSPVDGSNKKAKVYGKRPSEWRSSSEGSKALTNTCAAPEEHQRQALEMASRVQRLPGPVGIPQMPLPSGQLQRAPSQVSYRSILRSGEKLTLILKTAQPRVLSDAERQYSQNQANYARAQVINSPAAMVGMSPAQISAPSPMNPTAGQSPAVSLVPHQPVPGGYEVGINGAPMSARKAPVRSTPSLNLDGMDGASSLDTYDPPASAASSVKKRGGKAGKPGPKAGGTRGGKSKNGRGRPSSDGLGSTESISTPVFGQNPSQGEMYAPPSSTANSEGMFGSQQQLNSAELPGQGHGQEQEVDTDFLNSLDFTNDGMEGGLIGAGQGHHDDGTGRHPLSAPYNTTSFEGQDDGFNIDAFDVSQCSAEGLAPLTGLIVGLCGSRGW
jgi:hypothetical protein